MFVVDKIYFCFRDHMYIQELMCLMMNSTTGKFCMNSGQDGENGKQHFYNQPVWSFIVKLRSWSISNH